jgi:hypothetical protein
MTTWTILSVIGWVSLITSWIVPRFVKDETDKSFWGGALSAFALGVFVSALVVSIMK